MRTERSLGHRQRGGGVTRIEIRRVDSKALTLFAIENHVITGLETHLPRLAKRAPSCVPQPSCGRTLNSDSLLSLFICCVHSVLRTARACSSHPLRFGTARPHTSTLRFLPPTSSSPSASRLPESASAAWPPLEATSRTSTPSYSPETTGRL